jgi:hypothetical protein
MCKGFRFYTLIIYTVFKAVKCNINRHDTAKGRSGIWINVSIVKYAGYSAWIIFSVAYLQGNVEDNKSIYNYETWTFHGTESSKYFKKLEHLVIMYYILKSRVSERGTHAPHGSNSSRGQFANGLEKWKWILTFLLWII